MTDCVFCKIASGQIPSTKIYENSDVMSFLDISPANKGHSLVVTKGHFETILDIPEGVLSSLILSTKKISGAIVKGLNADGFNILMNNKKVSGQLVPHAHFHIIPRFENDGIDFKWPHKKYEENEIGSIQEKIRRYL